MTEADPLDTMLATLLTPDATAPDPVFVGRTLQLVAAGEAIRGQRRRMIGEWLWHMAALCGLLAGLVLFSRLPVLAALPRGGLLAVASPLALVVLLWLLSSGVVDPRMRRR